MSNPYDSVTVSGYNNSPPPDDGSETEANRVKWETIKTKLPDPLKTAIETVNTNIADAFDAIAFNGINTQSSPYTVQESDQGAVIRTDSDVTLLPTGTAQAGFFVVIQNVGNADLTIDADGTEKILVTTNGDAVDEDETFTLSPQQTLFLVADGTNGWVVVQSAPQVIFGTDEASDDDYIVTSPGYRVSALQEGPLFIFYPQTDNEGAATVNWDDTGAKDLKKGNNENVGTGDILAERPVLMTYDATEDAYVVINPQTSEVILDEFVGGLNLTINATDSNHDIDAQKGTAAVTNAGGSKDYAVTGTAFTKKIDDSWAEGDGQGGMAIKTMTGTFTTSGTDVTGSGTDFDNEFEVDDVLFSDSESVARKITAIASGTSMTIDSAFPSDIGGGGDNVKKGGLAPDTLYNYFIIKDAETQAVDFGFDTTDDAEVLLSSDASDYEFSKKIGEVDTDSDSNVRRIRNFSSQRTVEEIQDVFQLLHVQDQKSSGTFGQGLASATWNQRDVNTVLTNEISGASIGSNQITLPAGTYDIECWVTIFIVNSASLRLRDTTAGSNLPPRGLTGSDTEDPDPGAEEQGYCSMTGRFTLTQESVLEIQNHVEITNNTNGGGSPAGITDWEEVYLDARIWKLG